MTSEAVQKILLIEDNTTDAHLVQRAILSQGLCKTVEWCKDGEQALHILKNATQDAWAFILLDIMLPKVTGLEILHQLRQEKKLASLPPIVIFSSSSIEKDVNLALTTGASAFYTKPDSYTSLKKVLATIFQNTETSSQLNN